MCVRANKTNINQNSVISIIRHAKQNAKLYEEMVELGYSDESFPVWWFSPARGAGTTETPAQRTLTDAEVAEGAEDRTDTLGEEGYDLTPPRTPTPREAGLGRPALAPASDAKRLERESATLSERQPAMPAMRCDLSGSQRRSATLSECQRPSATLS